MSSKGAKFVSFITGFWPRVIIRGLFAGGEGIMLNILAWKLTAGGRVDLNIIYQTWISPAAIAVVALHFGYEALLSRTLEPNPAATYSHGLMAQLQPDILNHLRQKLSEEGVQGVVDGVLQTHKAFKLPPQQRG
jgi:hypothetical protein